MARPGPSHEPTASLFEQHTSLNDRIESTSARLQFRLPDGSSVTNTFPADSPLETIRQYIITQLGPSTSSVTLYTTYPRRELTDEDLVKSLADLGLAPSSTLVVASLAQYRPHPATLAWGVSLWTLLHTNMSRPCPDILPLLLCPWLIVLPLNVAVIQKSNNAISPSGSLSFSELFLWVLSPLFSLIDFLKAFLFGSPDLPRGAHNPVLCKLKNMLQSQQPNSTVRRRAPGGGSFVKEQGGIYRLHNRDDEDDDNNT